MKRQPSEARRLTILPAALALALSVPVLLPIGEFEAVALLAMTASLLAIPLMFVQFCCDSVESRPGGGLRLLVLGFVGAAFVSWLVGIASFGLDLSATLSFVNWIALGALVVAGQCVLASTRRIGWMLNTWTLSYSLLSVAILIYLCATFGVEMFSSTDRGPFQSAIQSIVPTWPNYFGMAIVVAICIVHSHLILGSSSVVLKAQLVVLLIGLVITFSRGSYIACIVGITTISIAAGGKRRVILLALGGSVLALLTGFFVPAVRYQLIATFTPDTSQSLGVFERLAFAREALRVWMEQPTWGIGFFQFAKFVDPAEVYFGLLYRADLGSVHNEFLTTLLKSGWVGMLSLAAIIIAAIRVCRRAVRSAEPRARQLGLAGLGITAALLVGGFTLESLRTIGVSGIFWALVGALDGVHQKMSDNGRAIRAARS